MYTRCASYHPPTQHGDFLETYLDRLMQREGLHVRQIVHVLGTGPEKPNLVDGCARIDDGQQRLVLVVLGDVVGTHQAVDGGGEKGIRRAGVEVDLGHIVVMGLDELGDLVSCADIPEIIENFEVSVLVRPSRKRCVFCLNFYFGYFLLPKQNLCFVTYTKFGTSGEDHFCAIHIKA